MVRFLAFLALVFTALALVPVGAHLFSLPNKIGMSQDQYFVAQSIYNGWWRMAFILVPAMLLQIAFTYSLRDERLAFFAALVACACLASTLLVFFAWTQPANATTENWTTVPADWGELRQQWEYSHAANAGLTFVSFCLLALATLSMRR